MNNLELRSAVLKKYPRAIYHMRAQLARGRLMPMLGAGVGRDIGLPGWLDLVDRLASHSSVDGKDLEAARGSNTSRTQMLYQHFRSTSEASLRAELTEAAARERAHRFRWSAIVRECLYATKSSLSGHPYLASLVPLVIQSPLTVNYNFDDCLQELIDSEQKDGRELPYETVWEPVAQYRRDRGVIYHPNGFIPHNVARNASTWFVFAEDSFADQLIDAQRGHYSTLQSHLFRHTGLLIGLSLDDATLKHLLRQSEKANPAHVHYYVAYRRTDEPTNESRERAVLESNFHTYGLVTLFLDAVEIATLAELLTLGAGEFEWLAQRLRLPRSYTYYLSGAVGVGKTSVLAYFKSLSVFDEWLEPKPEVLMKPTDSLSQDERERADRWIDDQFEKKNFMVGRVVNQVSIVDRSPIDPLAFAHDPLRRANELLDVYKEQRVSPGMVLHLRGAPPVMHIRTRHRHKGGSIEYIARLQERFDALWSCPAGGAAELVDTVDRALLEVVKDVARVVYLGAYVETPLSNVLSSASEAL